MLTARWICTGSSVVGYVPAAITSTTFGLRCSDVCSARSRAARLVDAIRLPSSIAFTNALAASGLLATHDASAPYPLTGNPCAGPESMSSKSWSPNLSEASVTYGPTSYIASPRRGQRRAHRREPDHDDVDLRWCDPVARKSGVQQVSCDAVHAVDPDRGALELRG